MNDTVFERPKDESRVYSQEKILNKEDVFKWSPLDFDEYFKIMDICYRGGKLAIDLNIVKAIEQYRGVSKMVDLILKCVNKPTSDPQFKLRSFFMRLNTFIRIVKQAIGDRPELVSPLTIERQMNKVEYDWMKKYYFDTGLKREIALVPVKTEIVQADGSAAGPQARLALAMGKVADVYEMIAGSITAAELKTLKPMDKINALKSLSYIHASVGKWKPGKGFKIANPSKASKEELEKELLNVNDESE